jgi:hypothetical protein
MRSNSLLYESVNSLGGKSKEVERWRERDVATLSVDYVV